MQDVGWPAVNYFFADKLEIEGFGHFPNNRRVLLLLLAYSLGTLLRLLPLQLVELVFLFPFLRSRGRLPTTFDELIEWNTIDRDQS